MKARAFSFVEDLTSAKKTVFVYKASNLLSSEVVTFASKFEKCLGCHFPQ
jgi:hypothetical protein